jgi:hypothetical protein
MIKNKYYIIFLCSMLLLCVSAEKAMGEEYIKNIDIGESDIKIDQTEFPPVAYLYLELKNNCDKKISNLTFEISYYDTEGYLIKKATVKNALTEAIPKGETRKYKIRLNGDVMNIEHEQYPYSQRDEVNEFDIKIKSVQFTSR